MKRAAAVLMFAGLFVASAALMFWAFDVLPLGMRIMIALLAGCIGMALGTFLIMPFMIDNGRINGAAFYDLYLKQRMHEDISQINHNVQAEINSHLHKH